MAKQLTGRAFWAKQVEEQERWIASRGGSEAGYVAYYGSRDDAMHYGDGGEAIYAADVAALEDFKRRAGR